MNWLTETWLYLRALWWTAWVIAGIIGMGVVGYIIIKERRT